MFFRDIVGQEEIKERLRRSVVEERISHAQLLAGGEGTGTLGLALAYAQYVSCSDRKEDDSCGTCPSCKKFAKLVHPDLHFVFPVIKTTKFKEPVSDNYIDQWRGLLLESSYFNLEDWFKKIEVENSQGMIYVYESREIYRKLNLKSYEGEFKIMIIWNPEKMNEECANKLLKMIEEPPEKTLFLLVTEKEEDIITTIRSRCQLIKVPSIRDNDMEAALSGMPESKGRDIGTLVHLCNGNYRKALNTLRSETDSWNLERFKELMRLSYTRKFLELFKWVDVISATGRESQKSFLLYAGRQVRENFIYNLKRPDLVYMDEPESEFSQRFSPFINERNIASIAEELEKAWLHVVMNGNVRIIFTDLVLKIVVLIRK